MLSLLISLLIILLILSIVYWVFTLIPVPAPFNWILRAVFGIIVLIVLLNFLLGGSVGLGVHPLFR